MKARVSVLGHELTLEDGLLEPFEAELAGLGDAPPVRQVHAAGHVVMRASYRAVAHSPEAPGAPGEILEHVDWDTTMAQRRRLDALGFGIAEAMDTAQRFDIGWPGARRLIEELGRQPLARPFFAGASMDHVASVATRAELVAAVCEQVAFIARHGGEPVLLPLRWLCDKRAGEDDFVEVYEGIVRQSDGPLWIHWLGPMFVPALAGYFPGKSFERVMALDRERIRGVKISLLDAARERAIRTALAPHGQIVLSGDDFHFAELIAGDAVGFSHALLGVFDAIARPAALALRFLAHGKRERFLELMRPCEALGRHVFGAPTMHYKAGLAFLAWINGLQPNALLPNHLERARDAQHYATCARLASAAGVIEDVQRSAARIASCD